MNICIKINKQIVKDLIIYYVKLIIFLVENIQLFVENSDLDKQYY